MDTLEELWTQFRYLLNRFFQHVHDGVDSQQIDYNNLKNLPAAVSQEWTFIDSKTFSGSGTQEFSSFDSYDLYKLVFVNIAKSSAVDGLNIDVTVNNNTGSNYSQQNMNSAGSGSGGGGATAWRILTAPTGETFFAGEYRLTGKKLSGANELKGIWGYGVNGDNGNGGGTILQRGAVQNDNVDVSSIQIISNDSVTGTVELWGHNIAT